MNTDSADYPIDEAVADHHQEEYQLYLPDRFDRYVRDDHAANQVLHDVVQLLDGVESTDFMGSHAPGEKPHEPRYSVWVEFTNEGMGHPMISPPVQTLIDRDRVKLCSVIECSDDHLLVSLRAVERTVEPITATKDDIPDALLNGDDDE